MLLFLMIVGYVWCAVVYLGVPYFIICVFWFGCFAGCFLGISCLRGFQRLLTCRLGCAILWFTLRWFGLVALLTFLLVISWRVCGFGLLLVAVVLVNVAVVLVLSGLGGIVKRALGLGVYDLVLLF